MGGWRRSSGLGGVWRVWEGGKKSVGGVKWLGYFLVDFSERCVNLRKKILEIC